MRLCRCIRCKRFILHLVGFEINSVKKNKISFLSFEKKQNVFVEHVHNFFFMNIYLSAIAPLTIVVAVVAKDS